MARKFRIINLRTPQRRLPNRCLLCRRIIGEGRTICDYCSGRNRFPKVRR